MQKPINLLILTLYEVHNALQDKKNDVEFIRKLMQANDNGWKIFLVEHDKQLAVYEKTQQDVQAVMDDCRNYLSEKMIQGLVVSFENTESFHPIYQQRSMVTLPSIGMLAAVEIMAARLELIPCWDASLVVSNRWELSEMAKLGSVPFQSFDEFFDLNPKDEK